MPLPATFEEYARIQVAAMRKWLLDHPVLDRACVTVHDNDDRPRHTQCWISVAERDRILRRKGLK